MRTSSSVEPPALRPDTPRKLPQGEKPCPGEYVWDTTYLGFNAWSERRWARLSYQYFTDSLLTNG
jgi:hypothetical protein